MTDNHERKETLKQKILDLHKGVDADIVRADLVQLMGKLSYNEIVQVEQELIREGLPVAEVTDMCDVHSKVLSGQIDLSGVKPAPPGHPVHTFTAENNALETVIDEIEDVITDAERRDAGAPAEDIVMNLRRLYGLLFDVDKHYRRKENLLFPFMEKHGITGPPKVMWAKHDEIRNYLKGTLRQLEKLAHPSAGQVAAIKDKVLRPAMLSVADMIMKETRILLPMCMEALEPLEWYEISRQSAEIGFCLYDPQVEWIPEDAMGIEFDPGNKGRIVLPSGSLLPQELVSMLHALPLDLTFVDKDDTVRFYSHGPNPIFDRNRAILGRKVQLCHPPKSVDIVNRILDDFRNNRQDKAEFWITLGGKFVYISYWAVRNALGEYLGTLEMMMDISRQRAFQGEQRLLDYGAGA